MVVFWVVTPCILVGGYQCFGGRYRLSLHFIMKMAAVCSSETLVTTVQRHNPQDHDRHLHRRENLKFLMNQWIPKYVSCTAQ
jgi:hypothetical protein